MNLEKLKGIAKILDCDAVISLDTSQYQKLKESAKGAELVGGYRKYKDRDGIEISYAGNFILITELSK